MKEQQHNWLWGSLIVITLAGAGAYYMMRDQLLDSPQTTSGVVVQKHGALQIQPDSLTINLSRTLNPLVKDVQGELIWNNKRQAGSVRIANLPSVNNDQFYQLWVFDRQGSGQAIPAGKFTQQKTAKEVYWELAAKELITEPYKFVVTLEENDDVVPEKLLLLAQP